MQIDKSNFLLGISFLFLSEFVNSIFKIFSFFFLNLKERLDRLSLLISTIIFKLFI